MTLLSGLFRLGRDAELRYTAGSNEPVASLSLAYNYGKKGADGNRPTQWVDASLWGKRAESLVQYLTKGTLIYAVLEDVHIETFDKRDGGQGHKLAARVSNVEFTGRSNEQGTGERPSSDSQAPRQQQPASRPAHTSRPKADPGGFDGMDDDIPF